MCGVPARWRGAAIPIPQQPFFICFDTAPWLDGKYSVWGEVIEGMEHIDAIKKGEGDSRIVDPDKIISMTLP
jgi:cyclophilin family peptidyl-prolyl cis-trans isomerase